MPAPDPHPTPYPDVNAMIHEVLAGAHAVLGDGLLGMYLGGSLASGDFDPRNSDIDFVVVTTGELSAETITALTSMHEHIAAGPSKWARELEGSYIPRQTLRRYDPANALHPHIFRGTGEGESRLFLMRHAADWLVHRHILREHGVVVVGPEPRTLIDPVHPDELRQAMRSFFPLWCEPVLRDPAQLRPDGYHAYTVVTLCRVLYTLEHGAVVSKPVAARWAQTVHGSSRWRGLIERAVAWDVHWDDAGQTLAFMRYTLQRQ